MTSFLKHLSGQHYYKISKFTYSYTTYFKFVCRIGSVGVETEILPFLGSKAAEAEDRKDRRESTHNTGGLHNAEF